MALIEEHSKDCEELLNKPFKSVHLFLDQYAELFTIGMFIEYHRSFLHNSAGLAVIESECGREARTAGEIHILKDYLEGPVANKGIEFVKARIGLALLYFNNMENFDPTLHPSIVAAWKGQSLCYIAFGNQGYDQYYRHISEY